MLSTPGHPALVASTHRWHGIYNPARVPSLREAAARPPPARRSATRARRTIARSFRQVAAHASTLFHTLPPQKTCLKSPDRSGHFILGSGGTFTGRANIQRWARGWSSHANRSLLLVILFSSAHRVALGSWWRPPAKPGGTRPRTVLQANVGGNGGSGPPVSNNYTLDPASLACCPWAPVINL